MTLTKASYSMIEGAVVNILDYGADPTGVADSTAAIQAAFDYAGSLSIPDTVYPNPNNYGVKGGTTVFLPAGEYAVSGRLNVPQNVNIVGAGRNSTLISSSYDGTILSNYVVPTQPGEYSQPGNVWRDFCINGDRTKTNQTGIELLRWDLSLMSNILIQNCGSNGIVIFQCLMSIFELIDCENNVGFGMGLRDGILTSIDPTLNNLPTNACTFNNCHALGNGQAGLLLAQYGDGSFGGGVIGCVFNNCIYEYNAKAQAPGAGYNVIITTNCITPNEFNECWVEDNAVNAHFYINPTDVSSPTRFTNLHHFSGGSSNLPNRCIIAPTGFVYINGAFGQNTSYKVINGSNSPFRLTNNVAHIWANNLAGNLVTDNNFVEDENNLSTGLYNSLNMNNYGAVYGPSSLKGQAGVYLDQWRTETQTYSFAAMEGGTGLVLGSGLTLPATQVRSGAGSPEGAITAPVGSMWLRTDGGAGTTLYIKETGTGNTGWAAK
jgi:hypothetical protein